MRVADGLKMALLAELPVEPHICPDVRQFVMELAMTMGVVDVCADEEGSIPVSELMPKMLARAREDRERWQQPATKLDDAALREILAQAYSATKGIPFGEYVRQRHLDRDGEEAPMLEAMRRVRDLQSHAAARAEIKP